MAAGGTRSAVPDGVGGGKRHPYSRGAPPAGGELLPPCLVGRCEGGRPVPAAGEGPYEHLWLHGRHQRRGQRIFPHSGGVLPDVSRHDGGHVLSVLRGGVPGPHSGRLCAVPDGDPGKEAVRLRLPGVHGVRGHGHAAALAAVSPDAGQPGPVRIFGDQQRHHAPGGGAAVYSGPAAGPGQRL